MGVRDKSESISAWGDEIMVGSIVADGVMYNDNKESFINWDCASGLSDEVFNVRVPGSGLLTIPPLPAMLK